MMDGVLIEDRGGDLALELEKRERKAIQINN
jgi:hypothetical protein